MERCPVLPPEPRVRLRGRSDRATSIEDDSPPGEPAAVGSGRRIGSAWRATAIRSTPSLRRPALRIRLRTAPFEPTCPASPGGRANCGGAARTNSAFRPRCFRTEIGPARFDPAGGFDGHRTVRRRLAQARRPSSTGSLGAAGRGSFPMNLTQDGSCARWSRSFGLQLVVSKPETTSFEQQRRLDPHVKTGRLDVQRTRLAPRSAARCAALAGGRRWMNESSPSPRITSSQPRHPLAPPRRRRDGPTDGSFSAVVCCPPCGRFPDNILTSRLSVRSCL